MRIRGFVESDVSILPDGKASYDVEVKGKSYSVVSGGSQAAKDAIFVRRGQTVSIEGDRDNKTLHARRSRIDIKPEIKGGSKNENI